VTFGAPSPRPAHCASCTCGDPGPLAARLRTAAQQYVACLTDGEDVDMDIGGADYAFTRPFRNYIPEAVSARGGVLATRNEGGRLIYTVHLPDMRPTKETHP
jgi:hypothetical protein